MPIRIMIKLRNLLSPVLLLLAGCGDAYDSTGANGSGTISPMAGNWAQDTGTDVEGMTITFDGPSDRISVHLAPRADGTHGHGEGKNTYSYDAATKALTVNSELMGHGKADKWIGVVSGDAFELAAADMKLKFKKGGKPAGH